jgi:hypothetical protein
MLLLHFPIHKVLPMNMPSNPAPFDCPLERKPRSKKRAIIAASVLGAMVLAGTALCTTHHSESQKPAPSQQKLASCPQKPAAAPHRPRAIALHHKDIRDRFRTSKRPTERGLRRYHSHLMNSAAIATPCAPRG